MSEAFELCGTISKIDMAYVYVSTSLGTVFAPTAALKEKFGSDLNYTKHFKQNEEVRMIVTKQNSSKNGCSWIAKSIKKVKSKSNQVISEEVKGPIIATVTSVTQTYAFAQSPEGTVFIPGDAFDKNYVQIVSRYLKVDDQVFVHIKEQIGKNGVRLCAVSAVKNFEVEKELNEVAKSQKKYIIGYGIVLTVDKMECEIFDERNSISVRCSLLAYTGGYRDNNTSATVLTDIINPDDLVMFKAQATNQRGIFHAVDWKHIVHKEDFVIPIRKLTAESTTQTMTDIVYTKFKNFLIDNPDEQERIRHVIDHFPASALPDSLVLVRELERQDRIELKREEEENKRKKEADDALTLRKFGEFREK